MPSGRPNSNLLAVLLVNRARKVEDSSDRTNLLDKVTVAYSGRAIMHHREEGCLDQRSRQREEEAACLDRSLLHRAVYSPQPTTATSRTAAAHYLARTQINSKVDRVYSGLTQATNSRLVVYSDLH